ncbi:phosphatase PAP2 family protein [Amycolatopsis benzoatilytica]|uniref:phosphatase PAP2 family protein n=1 Tax=Amycolatopsis benzoatilytica TaxID=346045 RepID=UPI0003784C32|nr:phosphatase PAP2 family protein [Amycolatopsis benzoatilytica]
MLSLRDARRWLVPVLAFAGFVLSTQQVLSAGLLTHADEPVHELLTTHHDATLDAAMTVVGAVAQFPVSAPILAACAAYLAIRRASWTPVLACGIPLLLLSATTVAAKALIGRAGPDKTPGTLHDGGTAFPSGHAATAAVVSLLLVALFVPARRKTTWLGLTAAFCWSLLTGFSRVYTDDHWLSDVVGGLLLGLAIGGAVFAVLRRTTESDSISPRL